MNMDFALDRKELASCQGPLLQSDDLTIRVARTPAIVCIATSSRNCSMGITSFGRLPHGAFSIQCVPKLISFTPGTQRIFSGLLFPAGERHHNAWSLPCSWRLLHLLPLQAPYSPGCRPIDNTPGKHYLQAGHAAGLSGQGESDYGTRTH